MFVLASKETIFSKRLFENLKYVWKNEFIWIKNNEILNELKEAKLVFFFHWNFIVKEEFLNRFKCITIHTSNLPEGRGGSPIQNQIINKIIHTRVNALEMHKNIDAGAIYVSKEITLQGNLNDIWNVITNTTFDLIKYIIENPNLQPKSQTEKLTISKRRKDNIIPFEREEKVENIYDFIRMLDGNEYPLSYYDIGNFRLKFKRSQINYKENNLLCDVIIEKIEKNKK